MTKQHIKNRIKIMKDHFVESYELFGSLIGFSWNSITRRFEAEEEVWKDLIREKPHAAKWKTMQIKHYDVLRELLGIDRAVRNKFATNTEAFNWKRKGKKEREKKKNNVDLNTRLLILIWVTNRLVHLMKNKKNLPLLTHIVQQTGNHINLLLHMVLAEQSVRLQ
ncbi:hypothetical protein P8452_53489 [Trifolium repens]|nr:hypothetical protein P8452_53489 [Trifolium repens]